MIVETHLLTFGASAQQCPVPTAQGSGGLVFKFITEPLRSNTAVSFTGSSAVTNDGSGTGVVKEHAAPATTTALDPFTMEDQSGINSIDPNVFWVHGTATQKMKVSYFIR